MIFIFYFSQWACEIMIVNRYRMFKRIVRKGNDIWGEVPQRNMYRYSFSCLKKTSRELWIPNWYQSIVRIWFWLLILRKLFPHRLSDMAHIHLFRFWTPYWSTSYYVEDYLNVVSRDWVRLTIRYEKRWGSIWKEVILSRINFTTRSDKINNFSSDSLCT